MINNSLLIILFLAFIGSILALIGGVLFLLIKPWKEFLARYAPAFAAGVFITISLLGLLPEAFHLINHQAFQVVLISFLAAYLFESVIGQLHHHQHHAHRQQHQSSTSVALIIFGDTIHNFIDGAAITLTYLVSPGLGCITALSTFLHEVPHEIGDFGVLLNAGLKKSKIFWLNLLSSLATFAGALLFYWLPISESISGKLMAVAAGLFLYLGASDFLPEADDKLGACKALFSVLLGAGLIYLTLFLVPHQH